jgi:hypothetical protein
MLLEPAHADTFAVSWTGTVVQVEPFVGEVTVIWAVAVAARIERNAAHRSIAGMVELCCMTASFLGLKLRFR